MTLLSTRRIVAIGLVCAGFVALSVSAQTYLSMLGHGHSFWRMLTWQLGSWSLWALVSPVVLRAAGTPLPVDARGRRVASLVGVGLLGIAAHITATALLAVWFQPFIPVFYTFPAALVAVSGSQLATDVLVYAVLLLLGRTLAVSDRAAQLTLRETRLEAELARANLEALRLEIQPHFLFNTLNSIAALIRLKANDKALDMLLGLSGLMRATIDRPVEHVTPLAAEVEFVKQYASLHAARFGERLQVDYAIPPDCPSVRVPTFLLQPLVENALRHGVARQAGPARIEIGAERQEDTIRIWVKDSGVGLPPGFSIDTHQGTGLRNIRVRLQQLYGADAQLTVAPQPGGGVIATVTLPVTADLGEARAIA
ncbi:MAG: sensor histidine kinase [Vicinamibacterales bacterium]